MQDCKGCPVHWQTGTPVWEAYPETPAPKAAADPQADR